MRPADLPALTSLRLFAAGAVVFGHMLGKWGLPKAQDVGLHLGIGVDFFFALSGFILAYNYRRIDGLMHAIRVIGYRIARIWPLHLAMLLVWLVIARNPRNPAAALDTLWANALMMHAWFGSYLYAYSGNGPSWTLSVELAFYLIFPVLVLVRSVTLIAATMAITAITVLWALAYWGPASAATAGVSGHAIMRMHPGSFFVLFSGGILTARLFMSREWRLNHSVATLLEGLCVLGAVAFFLIHRDITLALARAFGLPGVWTAWLPHALGVVLVCPLLFILAIGRGLFTKVLSAAPLVYLGHVSFALYLVHQPFQTAFTSNGYSQLQHLPFFLAALVLATLVGHHLVENPAQRFLRAWIDRVTGRVRLPPVASVSPSLRAD